MYIFAKFVADHVFLQNLDKINIKNSKVGVLPEFSKCTEVALHNPR
jgi:hypothetical protein